MIPEARLQEIDHLGTIRERELVAEVRRQRDALQIIADDHAGGINVEIARAALTEESEEG